MAAATQKAQSKTRVRRDPVRRTADGVSPLARLTNTDPNKRYVWVNTNDALYGVDYYLSLGYDIERHSEDGVKQVGTGRNPFRKAKPGEESFIMFQGNVLMSAPLEVAEEIDMYGPDGNTGQADWDAVEKRISRRGRETGLVRSIPGILGSSGSPVVEVQNMTSGPKVELHSELNI